MNKVKWKKSQLQRMIINMDGNVDYVDGGVLPSNESLSMFWVVGEGI